ncbi:MAG: hypothetical protein RIE08_06120 [Acidimicrobiales bacterium]
MSKMIRLLPALLVIVIVAAACGSSGDPKSFDDQVEDGQSLAERNFVDGCKVELADADDEVIAAAANAVCECAYDRFTGADPDVPAAETITFEEFEQLDDELREDINSLDGSRTGEIVQTAVRTCIQQVASS